MDNSAFEQITSSLTVKSICGPLGPDIPAGTDLLNAEELLDPGDDPNSDPWNNPSRVTDPDGNTVGVLWFENWAVENEEADPDASIVDEVMERPEPFVTSDTSILDAIQLLDSADSEIFYVVHVNKVVGVLRYSDLFHPLARLAFLALALEIEDLALRLCQFGPTRDRCWQSISENRQRKAKDVFKLRNNGREPQLDRDIAGLIECTYLIDKARMIWKEQLISSATRADVLGFFHTLQDIRDRCAHPRADGPLLAKRKLADFIRAAYRMRNSLLESMQVRGISRLRPKVSVLADYLAD